MTSEVTEDVQEEPQPLHGTVCTHCKVRRDRRGKMLHRGTAYDGAGRANVTCKCTKCGWVEIQNEIDPRLRQPEESEDSEESEESEDQESDA